MLLPYRERVTGSTENAGLEIRAGSGLNFPL
jgi:hypothetical protein